MKKGGGTRERQRQTQRERKRETLFSMGTAMRKGGVTGRRYMQMIWKGAKKGE